MGARYMIKKVYPNTLSLTKSSTTPVKDDEKYNKYNHKCIALTTPTCSKTSDKSDHQYKDSIALTVWKKSLLLNCKGFTVFDGKGNLVFRVDNYLAANKVQILLMDTAGNPLFTIRRKWLSWGENWLIYKGEEAKQPNYLVQKQGNLLTNNSKTSMGSLARVFSLESSSSTPPPSPTDQKRNHLDMKNKKINWCKDSTTTSSSGRCKQSSMIYEIEGSYSQRNVVMYDNKMQRVAEIKRKETTTGVTLGGDVFKLIILRPDAIHTAFAMAIVILLDQMFGS